MVQQCDVAYSLVMVRYIGIHILMGICNLRSVRLQLENRFADVMGLNRVEVIKRNAIYISKTMLMKCKVDLTAMTLLQGSPTAYSSKLP